MKDFLLTNKRLLHVLLGLSLIDWLMYFGQSEKAKTVNSMWSDPFVTLMELWADTAFSLSAWFNCIAPIVAFTIMAWAVGKLIELMQEFIAKGSGDIKDIIATALGAPVAMLVMIVFGASVIRFYISSALLVCALGYLIKLLWPIIKTANISVVNPFKK